MSKDVAVSVKNVSKTFKLPHEKNTSVKSAFINVFRQNRTFEKQQALKDISFEIKKGEFFGIVGRNGSGKSTLLKIIASIYQPSEGSLEVKGKLVPFIELGVGFNPELTGRENVYLNGALLGFSEKEVSAMYQDIVEFAELEKFMDQKLKNYSSGMQVRLAFSMAIRSEADILLIDEVLAVGDADFQRKCFNYFDKLKRSSTTVIFVSHDMDAVREYCDRALLIEKSRMIEIGSTQEVSQEYTKLFVGGGETLSETSGERWGDKSILVDKISVVVKPESITVRETLKAMSGIENPIVGFRIRDAAGKEITGTNSIIENRKLPIFNKGQKIDIEWKMVNILRDGEYTIDPAILHKDGITVADWWNEACNFRVTKDRHLPYSIDPGFKFTIGK